MGTQDEKREKDNFIMLPTVDFCFKELMQNPKVRKGFIAAILGKAPKEVRRTTLVPTALRKESEDDKLGILDVLIELEDETKMNMEMQVSYFDCWTNRVLFYLGKIYTGQIKEGEDYDKLRKCIHVSILEFVHFPQDKKCCRKIVFLRCRDGRTACIEADHRTAVRERENRKRNSRPAGNGYSGSERTRRKIVQKVWMEEILWDIFILPATGRRFGMWKIRSAGRQILN